MQFPPLFFSAQSSRSPQSSPEKSDSQVEVQQQLEHVSQFDLAEATIHDPTTLTSTQKVGQVESLQTKALSVTIPLCILSLLSALYYINSRQQKSNEFFKKIDQPEKIEGNKDSEYFMPAQNQQYLNFVRDFSLLLCLCTISALWNKLNKQFERTESLQKNLTKLETKLEEVAQNSISNFSNGLNRPKEIQALQSEFNIQNNRFHQTNATIYWDEIDNKPSDLKEYGLLMETLHRTITDEFFLTDENWVRAVHRREAGFFLPKRDEFLELYKPGNLVKFADGEMRKITRAEPNGERYLNIFVEGPILNPEKVGLPSRYSVVIPN